MKKYFFTKQAKQSYSTSFKVLVLALSLFSCSSLLNGCQLNNQSLSDLFHNQKVMTDQQIANKKMILAKAYDLMLPQLNSYYPINSTTYGLIKDDKLSPLDLINHEVLAQSLIQKGMALCQSKDNCPNNSIYLKSTIIEDETLDYLLISIDSADLKLTELFNKQGIAISTMAINTNLQAIAKPYNIKPRAKRHQKTAKKSDNVNKNKAKLAEHKQSKTIDEPQINTHLKSPKLQVSKLQNIAVTKSDNKTSSPLDKTPDNKLNNLSKDGDLSDKNKSALSTPSYKSKDSELSSASSSSSSSSEMNIVGKASCDDNYAKNSDSKDLITKRAFTNDSVYKNQEQSTPYLLVFNHNSVSPLKKSYLKKSHIKDTSFTKLSDLALAKKEALTNIEHNK